tara:strand:+ start:940 stop:1521 length:582 start_codon:yes stop_codon:yes gene_type:complete
MATPRLAQITTVKEFFNSQEVFNLVSLHNSETEKTTSGGVGNGEIDKTYRDVSVSFLNLSNTYFMDIAQKIVDAVEEANNRLWNFDIHGVCEEILYLTYNKGQHYQLHSDIVWDNLNTNIPNRKCTFILQLSSLKDYEGGEVVVGVGGLDELTIPKEKGSLTIFPSFLPHKVLEVTKGTRQSICGWVSGKSWE